jgi:hypothetical protein
LSVWRTTRTAGRLELYLLGTAQNHREALLDQGGARRWQFRCGLRRRAGPFDDAALYRFACGFNAPGELVEPEMWHHGERWLTVRGTDGIVPLGAHRERKTTCVDLYSTLYERASFALSGPAVEGRSVYRADMLGRTRAGCSAADVSIDPLAFLRVVIV